MNPKAILAACALMLLPAAPAAEAAVTRAPDAPGDNERAAWPRVLLAALPTAAVLTVVSAGGWLPSMRATRGMARACQLKENPVNQNS